MKTVFFKASGTICNSCSEIIKRQALKVDGVKSVDFDFSSEKGSVTFDESVTSIVHIFRSIEEKGYLCNIIDNSTFNTNKNNDNITDSKSRNTNKTVDDKKTDSNIDAKTNSIDKKIVDDKNDTNKKVVTIKLDWIFIILGLLVLGFFLLRAVEKFEVPQISQGMGYGLLFIVGLLTGFHCVSMCGGFVVSYTSKNAQEGRSSNKSHLMYAVGKVTSYTLIGAIFGFLGSIITFTPFLRGTAGILSGLFLVLFGLKMLNIFPILRKLQFKAPSFITKFVNEKHRSESSPLIIGLLNGLMIACGPLQAIYIMAAGSGSMIEGAKMLFIFSLGTLPVMLGFGYLTSFVSGKLTHNILKASGAIVIVMGLLMINNGLALTGSGYDIKSVITSMVSVDSNIPLKGSSNDIVLKSGFQEIRMDVTRSGWVPNKFILKKGVPVKWIINGKEITNCNRAIQVPKLGLNFNIKPGEQVIEFTPKEEGVISWSCWMGMIPGSFIVKAEVNSDSVKELDSINLPTGGGCGCGA